MCAVLSAIRLLNPSENPLRQRTLQSWSGEGGSWLAILNNALIEHGVGDLHETSDVCADHEIAGFAVLLRCIPRDLENRGHDMAYS